MARLFGSRTLVPALGLAAVVALSAAPAHASRGYPGLALDSPEMAQALLVTSGIAFGAADVAFAIAWRPMPIVLSLLQVGVAGILVPAIALDNDGPVGQHVGAAASIVWFTGHGLYNVAIYPEYARERARAREQRLRELERKRYGFALQSRMDGAVLNLYGRL